MPTYQHWKWLLQGESHACQKFQYQVLMLLSWDWMCNAVLPWNDNTTRVNIGRGAWGRGETPYSPSMNEYQSVCRGSHCLRFFWQWCCGGVVNCTNTVTEALQEGQYQCWDFSILVSWFRGVMVSIWYQYGMCIFSYCCIASTTGYMISCGMSVFLSIAVVQSEINATYKAPDIAHSVLSRSSRRSSYSCDVSLPTINYECIV